MTRGATYEPARGRSVWDLVLGVLSVAAGAIILGHVALAGIISVLLLGWTLVFGGVAMAAAAAASWEDSSHRWSLPVGVVVVVVGFGFIRNPGAGVLALTLLGGSLMLVAGMVRLVSAFAPDAPRGILLVNGLVTFGLGVLVLNRWPVSALWFLGTALGIQLILDGMTTVLIGRVPIVRPTKAAVSA
jgi:uncharacterized membrane protein HdeD (DUF308 family)